MKSTVGIASIILVLGGASPAFASMPVNDAAQLDRRSETADSTIKLVPITTQRMDANDGVKCAVTTGKQASVKDPASPPQSGSGVKTIQAYAPTMPSTPASDAKGGVLASQTLFKATGDVVGSLEASRASLAAAQAAFRAAGTQIGTAPTVMGAFDMNSAARMQNGLAWNGAISSANIWVTAINALNLALINDTSRVAAGMQMGGSGQTSVADPACPAGMIGGGTAADPCRTPSSCSTTLIGTTPDPACVTARYVDTNGNVLFYLANAQDQNAATAAAEPSSPVTGPTTLASSQEPTLTASDVQAALQSITDSTR
jgi:hypothetical protein